LEKEKLKKESEKKNSNQGILNFFGIQTSNSEEKFKEETEKLNSAIASLQKENSTLKEKLAQAHEIN
jgi:hypothetical protein